MGAEIHGRHGDTLPPVRVAGRPPLVAIEWRTPVPSAQVKSAILLAGMRAGGTTIVRESVATRDHTERMLRARGVRLRSTATADGGATIEIEGGTAVAAMDERVPADPSAAAFWLVAGSVHPDAELRLAGVGVNPTRRAAIDILREMGASIDESPTGGSGGDDGIGEPCADLTVRSAALRAVDLDEPRTAAAIDEVLVLCLAATQARGRTRIRGAGELRVKESDRVEGIVRGLRTLGADVSVDRDDLVIVGPTPLAGAAVDSRGDHRLAMTFAVAGLVASGPVAIAEAASAAISDPRFFAQLEAARA
jgi:3-phosphoshikimate 1-carboxyvinyltransferase